jgi:hypothetical protein
MFERFTKKAIKVIMLAQEESRRLGHNFVGAEQILLGLIAEGTGSAANVLNSMGVKLKDARIEVEKIIGRGSGVFTKDMPFTPRGKRILEHSLEESQHLGHNYIDTEHLLLGLIRESTGVATRVLERFHVNLSALQSSVLHLLIPHEPNFSIELTEQQSQAWEEFPSSLDSFLIEIAERRNRIWEKYRNSPDFIAQLETMRVFSSEASTLSQSVPRINILGSGQIPEEIRLATSALKAELETVKLLEAEIEETEEEIKTIQATYILWGIVFLLIGLVIYFFYKDVCFFAIGICFFGIKRISILLILLIILLLFLVRYWKLFLFRIKRLFKL